MIRRCFAAMIRARKLDWQNELHVY